MMANNAALNSDSIQDFPSVQIAREQQERLRRMLNTRSGFDNQPAYFDSNKFLGKSAGADTTSPSDKEDNSKLFMLIGAILLLVYLFTQ